MKSILTTSILALVFTTVAQATPPPEKTVLSRAVRQCVFDQTLEVGASVTGQFGGTFYGYPTATQYGFDAGKSAYGGSPSSFFISHYRDMGLLFAAPQYKVGNKVPDNQACMVTNRRSRAGTGQIERLLSADLKENFDRASIIIGPVSSSESTCFTGTLFGVTAATAKSSELHFLSTMGTTGPFAALIWNIKFRAL